MSRSLEEIAQNAIDEARSARDEARTARQECKRLRHQLEDMEEERDAARKELRVANQRIGDLEAADLRGALDRQAKTIERLLKKNIALEQEIAGLRFFRGLLDGGMPEEFKELDAEFVGKLIRLTHPDRHPSDDLRAMANKATDVLLKIRKRLTTEKR